jgi:hypothetical protein
MQITAEEHTRLCKMHVSISSQVAAGGVVYTSSTCERGKKIPKFQFDSHIDASFFIGISISLAIYTSHRPKLLEQIRQFKKKKNIAALHPGRRAEG